MSIAVITALGESAHRVLFCLPPSIGSAGVFGVSLKTFELPIKMLFFFTTEWGRTVLQGRAFAPEG